MKSYFLATFNDSKYGSNEEPKSVLCGLKKEEAYQLKKTLDREYPGYRRVIFDENEWIAWLCRNSYENNHIGSTLDEFLEEEDILEEVTQKAKEKLNDN